jgi:hypothetical protein
MQVGNWVNAYFTLAMAIHTCITLVFRWPQKRRFGATVIAMGWLSAVAVGTLYHDTVFFFCCHGHLILP